MVTVERIAKGGANAWEGTCRSCGFCVTGATKRVVTDSMHHDCEDAR